MRVEEVLQATNGVLVKTKRGETIAGDILIGADGVHSTIRREMWRLAAKLQPGYFPGDELSSIDFLLCLRCNDTRLLIPSY